MGQRRNDAVVMDAQINLKKEECALGMEQRRSYAAVMGAKIKPRKEVYAEGMGHIAMLTMNLLHF